MNKIKHTMVALSVASTLVATTALAQSVAIENVTVHTATDAGVLNNATVVFGNGKITAINPSVISAQTVIDGKGKILTPGFIGALNTVGLVEVGQVKDSRDTRDDKIDILFDPSFAFNPKSTAIAFARKGGLTTSVVNADGGEGIFAGQTFNTQMNGEWDSILSNKGALVVHLGASHEGSRAVGMQALFTQLEDAKQALIDDKDKADTDAVNDESKILNAVLSGDKILAVKVDRASDILTLLKLKQHFQLQLVLIGAADAVLIAPQIAAANVPVVMNGLRNLPESFDSLHNSLDNAAKLQQAGVKVILTASHGAHSIYALRYVVGSAVANGMDYNAALKSVTVNAATTFKIDAGVVAVGKRADLVLWSGDPFEYSTQVDTMWIGGEQQSTTSRHDKLRDRYTTESNMPRAYTR
ncbi:amidohydrolase family protein [Shewanella intestini]|uniref:Amidohydrolase family protein n=1 Tax=Shewanella intestini TaxID=2017544 RepID=A0ABS5I483_9GAMM|nr:MULTISPECIES: amidohydrolase family protein [Shewanella]MBR9728832.1 amidohydrolase family protein [Shewanella intestini]MRG37102.1 amidohydrolase family protein [Shewanella sp. XMDDZSB0408]